MSQHIEITPTQLQQLLDCLDVAAEHRETVLQVLRTAYPDTHPQIRAAHADLDAYYDLAAHLLLHRTGTDPAPHRN